MKVLKTVRLAIATCALVAAGSSFASAEIVFMTSGSTVSVKRHANVGESVVLTLRSGGEVTLVERFQIGHRDSLQTFRLGRCDQIFRTRNSVTGEK